MVVDSAERELVRNAYGVLTTKRVSYSLLIGGIGNKYQEDVPLRHVVSVRHKVTRHIILGGILILMGGLLTLVYGFGYNNFFVSLLGLIPIAFGLYIGWGFAVVTISASNGAVGSVWGFPWQKQQAKEFVSAVREQLFDSED